MGDDGKSMSKRDSSQLAGKLFLGATAMLAVIVVAMVGWIFWTMYKPFNFFEAPDIWPLADHEIHPGDDVFSELSFCKTTDLPAEIGRMTTGKAANGSEYLFIHPNVSGSFPGGCYKKRVSVATVPINAPPGKYRVSVTISYQYSTFRVVQSHFLTEQFDVVPRPSGQFEPIDQ